MQNKRKLLFPNNHNNSNSNKNKKFGFLKTRLNYLLGGKNCPPSFWEITIHIEFINLFYTRFNNIIFFKKKIVSNTLFMSSCQRYSQTKENKWWYKKMVFLVFSKFPSSLICHIWAPGRDPNHYMCCWSGLQYKMNLALIKIQMISICCIYVSEHADDVKNHNLPGIPIIKY